MLPRPALALVAALAAGAACGDNQPTPDAAKTHSDAKPIEGIPVVGPTAMVVAGGRLAKLDIGSRAVTQGLAPAGAIGDDPVLRQFGAELFVVNRGGGSGVSILDDTTLAPTAQLGTDVGTDPRDVVLVGDHLYVPAAAGTGVVVLTRASAQLTTIDLSADDPDGKPNCMSAIAVGTDVYVACGLLDDTAAGAPPRGNGKIYVIDAATDTVRTSFELTTKNPVGLLEEVGDGTLAIPTHDPADGTGCVERITPGPTPVANGCIVRNVLLGGYATRVQFQPLVDSVFLWMAVSGMAAPNPQQLLAYDFTSGDTWPPVSTMGEMIGDVALCPDGTLVLSDVTPGAAGLRVYQLAQEVTTAPLSIGTPPTSPHGIVCF